MFLGTSVHETAQVVGAGQIYADIFSQSKPLDVATITKLVRNVFMAAVIPFMAYYYARKTQDGDFKGENQFCQTFSIFYPWIFIYGGIAFIGRRRN